VIYLRVSTPRQARKNNEVEGYSIPQQRDYCRRKAEELGAEVVGEYVDAGETARTTDRAQLRRMLADMADPLAGFDYIIVHKLDRLVRDRADDATMLVAMKQAKTTLVSVSEAIDDTPSGRMLQGIMASINQYYSDNLSAESKKGMAQKAKNGGTHGVCPDWLPQHAGAGRGAGGERRCGR
jgi:DNA invertase Pin-like site-specific DNA recombinase